MRPDFSIEKEYWDKDYVVVGVDEVGRGAIAGPVVAAAAATKIQNSKGKSQNFNLKLKSLENLGIDDSKKLTRKRREELEPIIKKYFYWGIGEAGAEVINKKGIVYATRLAMKRAIRKLPITNFQLPMNFQFNNFQILIDGRYVKGIGHQEAIVKGDQKSISIAAASIIAKVYRDNLMRNLCGKYIGYGFEKHVGYGTKGHAKAIVRLGMCKIHREVFVRSLLKITNF
jgi:ribonuclease HII